MDGLWNGFTGYNPDGKRIFRWSHILPGDMQDMIGWQYAAAAANPAWANVASDGPVAPASTRPLKLSRPHPGNARSMLVSALRSTVTGMSVLVDEDTINGTPATESSSMVTLTRQPPGDTASEVTITDLTVKLDTTSNPSPGSIVPFLGVRASARPTVGSLPAPFQITTKFLDATAQEVITNLTHAYELTLPGFSNRQYMLIFKENGTSSPDFVTNAELKAGTPNVYTFQLTTNSTYTVVDSLAMSITAGAGSDPHVTSIYGARFDLPHVARWWDLLKYEDLSIRAHSTGLRHGYFFNQAEVRVDTQLMKVNFNKQRIKSPPSCFQQVQITENTTNLAKSKKTMRAFAVPSVAGGLHLLIDMANHYIVPLFNRIPPKGAATGILARCEQA